MALKEQAGWNQTPADWKALFQLGPSSCWGLFCGDELASTVTTIPHSSQVAWIGMVLTRADKQGRGYATSLMDRAVHWIDANGFLCAKLDATPTGEPIYKRFGFEVESRVERWIREPHALPVLSKATAPVELSEPLHRLLAHESYQFSDGFALARPGSGAWYFGPCQSRSRLGAVSALEWFLSRHSGERTCWDLPAENRLACELAAAAGFVRHRTLHRMRRGPEAPEPTGVYAIAGFEFG